MKFTNEHEGQMDFYEKYLPMVDNTLTDEEIFNDYHDGVIRGNLLEFKLHISNLNRVLGQTIRYLSDMRVKGRNIPKNIVLVSINDETAYIYNSNDYLNHIEKIYIGPASHSITGFSGNKPDEILNFGNDPTHQYRLIQLLRSSEWTKINIDENNIVGWGTRFYNENPNASKSDFIGDSKVIGEIRDPFKFKDYIYPYTAPTNVRFDYLMDRLNDNLNKKNLGAFYTPVEYAEKSYELLKQAINRVPEGNDYIILDRCAGTGNLQKGLPDEILAHCVLSTVEYYEYKVLLELLGSKVRYIIPPTEEPTTYKAGLVDGGDALSEEYINNPVIQGFINDPKMTIIIFENPPYAETTSIEHQKKGHGRKSSQWKNNFVPKEAKRELKGVASNDMANIFIWSAFKYYLRQPTDSLIVYSPVMYWKSQQIIDKKFIDGFGFNRKHFHTNINAFISCILWANEEADIEEFELECYDIDSERELVHEGPTSIERIHSPYSRVYFDKRKFPDDQEDGIWCNLNGTEAESTKTKSVVGLFNENIIAYMAVYGSGFDNPDLHASLLRCARYDGHGFFLRADNYLEKLPMFGASRYITYNRHWTERARIMKSGDGVDRFNKDISKGVLHDYLLKVLLFTALEPQNHIRSLVGSDGRYYRNELCLDDTNGDTLATRDLKNLKMNDSEISLVKQFKKILEYAKKTDNYNSKYTYGLYQIDNELNTSKRIKAKGKTTTVYDYPQLNGEIKSLKSNVKEYYLKEIVPNLFEYDFIK